MCYLSHECTEYLQRDETQEVVTTAQELGELSCSSQQLKNDPSAQKQLMVKNMQGRDFSFNFKSNICPESTIVW